MYLTWRQRLIRHSELCQYTNWPVVSISTIPEVKRKDFLRNQQIVCRVLHKIPMKLIAKEFHRSTASVSRLMDRCLGGQEGNLPALTAALIPYNRIHQGARRSPLPLLCKQTGTQYAFQALLRDVPQLKNKLDEMLTNKNQDKSYAQNITPQIFHAEFLRLLEESNHPSDQYPYTHESRAYEACRRYLKTRKEEMEIQLRADNTDVQVTPPVTRRYRAFLTTQIDEQTIDVKAGIHLHLNNELIPLRLSRLSLLVAMNVETDCVLGYHLALTKHPNQQDMLCLLDNCIKPWQPMALTTPGFEYTPGACFPSGLPGALPVTFGTIQFDNALAHFAQSVEDALCRQQAASLSYGLPAQPKTRRWVEAVFNYVNTHISHRYASTTGSRPNDRIKESSNNARHQPVLTIRILEEALSIVLSHHNTVARKHLGSANPLDLIVHHCRQHYVRYVPELLRRHWQPFMAEKKVRIKWLKHEGRNPHINFYGVRYKGAGLNRTALKNKEIIVHYDCRDIRVLNAYTIDGQEIGDLLAPKSWQRFKHSLATRQQINKLVKQKKFNEHDALANHFRYLLEHKGMEKSNLQILRVFQEYTEDEGVPMILNDYETPSSVNAATFWSTKTANHRSSL